MIPVGVPESPVPNSGKTLAAVLSAPTPENAGVVAATPWRKFSMVPAVSVLSKETVTANTSSNASNHCFNVVFLFNSFLVLTVFRRFGHIDIG